MSKRSFIRLLPLALLAALALGACADLPGGIPPELVDSLPPGMEVSLEDNSIEFTDVVQQIASDQWVVGAFTLGISPDTQIEDGIAVGDSVKVHAFLTAEGDFVAREIAFAGSEDAASAGSDDSSSESDDSQDTMAGEELEFVGTVEAITDASWTIDGQVFMLTPETEIKDGILVGDMVKVHAYLSETGDLTAREIELTEESELKQDDFDSAEDMKFTGVIESIEGDTWVISGKTFTVDSGTEIDPGLTIGDAVEVYLFLTPDGMIAVREISLLDDVLVGQTSTPYGDDDGQDDEFEQDDDDDEDEHSGSTGSSSSEDDHSGSDHESDD